MLASVHPDDARYQIKAAQKALVSSPEPKTASPELAALKARLVEHKQAQPPIQSARSAEKAQAVQQKLLAQQAKTPEDHAAVLESPSVRGALSSILGPDYLAPSFGALHQGMQQEQPFHCDGTDHAVTLTTVRDHKPRRLIAMFYPGDVSRDMGPT